MPPPIRAPRPPPPGKFWVAAAGLLLAAAMVVRPAAATVLVRPPAPDPAAPLVIFYSGDGGWADIDRAVTARLAARGWPVVGVDSLHYFLKGRSAVSAARDMDALIRRYGAGRRVVLAGYSFGAAALPMIAQQLPPADLSKVKLLALLAPSPRATLALRPWAWLDLHPPGDPPIAPTVARLTVPVLCVHGQGDRLSDCTRLKAVSLTTVEIGRGHHFNRRYGDLATAILQAANAEA